MDILKATLADSRAQLDMTVRRSGASGHCYSHYSLVEEEKGTLGSLIFFMVKRRDRIREKQFDGQSLLGGTGWALTPHWD